MQNKNGALKFRPVALPCGEKGSTRLHTVNLFVGECPHMCKYFYAQGFRAFSKAGPMPVPMEAIINTRKFPRRLFFKLIDRSISSHNFSAGRTASQAVFECR